MLGNSPTSDSSLTFFLGGYKVGPLILTTLYTECNLALCICKGTGRQNVFYLKNRRWNKLATEVKVELSAGTLLLGEIVKEIKGERQRQVRLYALHIVDAICLGGIDIRQLHITERYCLDYDCISLIGVVFIHIY